MTNILEQISAVNQSLAEMDVRVKQTAGDSALLWRMTSGIFVFLMQVTCFPSN